MAHGTDEHLKEELKRRLSPSVSEAGSDSAAVEFATVVADVKVRNPADLGMDSWDSSSQSSFQGTPEKTKFFVDLHRSDPEACHRKLDAVTALPEVGTELLGFRLLAELGYGALGRVFLAEQGDLANRLVVLKISPSLDDEPQTLAQLQHTNIVPVYSAHRAGPLQVVCMPYFGSTTLARVIRDIDGRSSLPESGKELVSTIVARKGTVRDTDIRAAGTGAGISSVASSTPVKESVVGPPAASTDVGPAPNLELMEKFSYVEAVLWIGSGLADGLAHAHERGIVHRDLKPTNVLLTDDGQPMLLDFNLAQDTKLVNPATVQVGGTLPFMAPEQIQAYRNESVLLDFRGDIYSLGVILYQMLTGRQPFPTRLGPAREVLENMIQDRLQPPPSIRSWNKAVTPAVEAIVRKCLEPDPSRRYQTARHLKEDLDRHLENLPLRHAAEPSLTERAWKWKRRHPRLASATTVAVLAAALIAGLLSIGIYREQRLADMDARASLNTFLDGKKTVQYLLTARTDDPTQIENGVDLGRQLLASYSVIDDPAWQDRPAVSRLSAADQDRLRTNAGDLLLLLARGLALQASNQSESPQSEGRQALLAEALRLNELAESCNGAEDTSRALWAQRADLTRQLGRDDEAKKLHAKALATPMRTAADHYLVAAELTATGCYREAMPLLARVVAEDPQDFWAWFVRGVCHDHLAQGAEALACYNTCLALAPQSPWTHLNRGLTHLRQQSYKEAASDLDQVIVLRPNLAEAYKHRALARQGLKQYAEAAEDLGRALELGAAPTHVHFLRAAVRERAGDIAGAKQDRAEGMRRPPIEEMDWLTRGYARMNADPKAALEDFDQALKLNARSLAALQNKAHILSKLGRNEEAAKMLDKAVDLYPDFIPARAGRGVLLARLGKRDAAHKDAVECLARDNKPLTIYQLAGIYALTSKNNADDRQQAFRLLSASLQKGVGFEFLDSDRDLDPIRKCPEFQRLVEAARAIRATATASSPKTGA